jgi:hypothetical protein
MNDVITTVPASAISFATSLTRRIFSARSSEAKPRFEFKPWRKLSPFQNVRMHRTLEKFFLERSRNG